jgi:hypothetical protein
VEGGDYNESEPVKGVLAVEVSMMESGTDPAENFIFPRK